MCVCVCGHLFISHILHPCRWHWQGAACPLTAHLLRRLCHAGPFGDIQPAAAPDSSADRTAVSTPRAGLARPILAALQVRAYLPIARFIRLNENKKTRSMAGYF